MERKFVSIIVGSKSDQECANETIAMLKHFDVDYEFVIASAHRTPDRVDEYTTMADRKGAQVFICIAGMAAHLAGIVAGHTKKPVIGVPMDTGPLNGIDALYSTVMMPGGVPVATMAIGKAGAKNAGILAVQILALNDKTLSNKLEVYRHKMRAEVIAASTHAEKILKGN